MEGFVTVALQTITDVKYDVEVKEMSKIEVLKNELYRTTGIRNKIRLLKNKEELSDGKLLRDYKIEDGNVIQMLIVPSETININVSVLKKGNVSLEASDNDTIEDLREKLTAKEYCLGSAPRVYDFYYQSHKLDSNKPLHFYGLSEGSNIDLKCHSAKMKLVLVNAQLFVKVRILEFRGTDTIEDVANKVTKVVGEVEGTDIQNDDLVLFHSPKSSSETCNELDCEALTLNDYQITPYDQLMYIRYNIPKWDCADIEYEGRQQRIYDIESEESVCSLMLKIQDQFGVPVAKQKLTIPGMKEPTPNKKIPTLKNISLERLE